MPDFFSTFRRQIIGNDQTHLFPHGEKKILYADWTASGRLYQPIEDYMARVVGPYVANTHTETSLTGKMMTRLYSEAQQIIKKHVHATSDDVLLFCGFGQTSAINKFQRILNLKIPSLMKSWVSPKSLEKPLVIISHMEHHSNQVSWQECFCDVEIVARNNEGLPDLTHLQNILKANKHRKYKFGSFTACSNVTGIITPYHKMAEIMHEHGGYCFVDFAASAPYVKMDMHPANPAQTLDAIFFSSHKFLGGPGASGILIFNKSLYKNQTPDRPGGGTVKWTNPWGKHQYIEDIEIREDGGTPGFLQAIRASLAILLKEEMGIERIQKREEELRDLFFNELKSVPEISVLEREQQNRLSIISFYSLNRHHNLISKLLNDRFGIQVRGGCSCAGTYGHILFDIDHEKSKAITGMIDQGDLSEKPGWVRVSLHPTNTFEEVRFIAQALREVIKNYSTWKNDYIFNSKTGEFEDKNQTEAISLELSKTFMARPTSF